MDAAETERIELRAARDRLEHSYCGNKPPESDYWANLLWDRNAPPQLDHIARKYVWDEYSKSYVWATPKKDIAFNPNVLGLTPYYNNIWNMALEKAKQQDTLPNNDTYKQPSPDDAGGIIGWFEGIPLYFNNLREENKIKWIQYKNDLEEKRERENTNRDGQEVFTDKDLNDPWWSGPDVPDIPGKIGNTWDDFIDGVKTGWDAGGLVDYKTPLLIAGGVVLLILIIK